MKDLHIKGKTETYAGHLSSARLFVL